MKKIYIITGLLLFLFSCKTKQQIVTETVIKDSIITKTDTVIKDSIITILLPQDTVVIHKFIKTSAYINDIDTIIVNNGIVGAKAWLIKNNLGVIAYVNDSSLFYKLDSARIIISKQKESYSNKETNTTKTITKIKNSKFANFTIWFFWLVIAVIISYIIFITSKI